MIFQVPVLALILIAASGLLSNRAHALSFPHDQQSSCFAFPADSAAGVSPTREQLAAAWGMDSIRYVENLQHLTIVASEQPLSGLNQRLIPTEKGSTRSLVKWPLPPARTYQFTQKVYLPPNFDWGGRNEGGKLGFGFGGGSAPTGGKIANDGFTARFMWRGNHDGTASLVVYAYSADRTQNLPFGDDLKLIDVQAPTDEWFELSLEVTTNSHPWESDGSVRAWFNGELALSQSGIQWQSEGTEVFIDSLTYGTFYGGADSSWSPDAETYVRFADVCMSMPEPESGN